MPPIAFAALASLVALAGCEKVSHENIDRWENTEKGAGKLREALAGDHDAGLRAHAAQVLIRIGELDHVLEALRGSRDRDRAAIIDPLIDRLARDAQLADAMDQPQSHHVTAKDALFDLRSLATRSAREAIDRHLIGWLTGFYEGRSATGRYSGRRIVRAIGPMAGEPLVAVAREILERPPAADGSRVKLGPELLGSLAFSQHPKALNLLLDFVTLPQRDDSLPSRAAAALRAAYIAPKAIEAAPGSSLAPLADRLEQLAMDGQIAPAVSDLAIELLAEVGMPGCLPPFVALVAHRHENPSFVWVAAQNGIRCGGVAGIAPIVEAIPTRRSYPRALLDRYLWKEILSLGDKRAVAAEARRLLSSDSWVAKVTAVELLGKLQIKGQQIEDAERVATLARDRTRLRGWYTGAGSKPDPTLGQVAIKVARQLREVAQPTKSK